MHFTTGTPVTGKIFKTGIFCVINRLQSVIKKYKELYGCTVNDKNSKLICWMCCRLKWPNRHHLRVQILQWKHPNNVWNLFTASTRVTSIGIVLVSLLLTWNSFLTLFWCFYCCIWTSKCGLGQISEQNPATESFFSIVTCSRQLYF